MNDITIRVYVLDDNGIPEDRRLEFELASFGGNLPAIGDTILNPGVRSGLDRSQPENRRIWTVRDRVFNPRDLTDYVVLVVSERQGSQSDTWAY